MSSRSRSPARRFERGFSLLEVLVAFAMLAGLTAMMTTMFVKNVETAVNALSHRELREAADTIFRKMVYETEEYKDNDEGTLDEVYGEFARLTGWQRDRWAIYRYTLEKKLTNVAGTSVDADESLFGEDTGDESSSSTSTDSTSTTDETTEGDETGIELMKMTLRIFRADEQSDQALLTLVTWYDHDRGKR